jgi:hypothetical protein
MSEFHYQSHSLPQLVHTHGSDGHVWASFHWHASLAAPLHSVLTPHSDSSTIPWHALAWNPSGATRWAVSEAELVNELWKVFMQILQSDNHKKRS